MESKSIAMCWHSPKSFTYPIRAFVFAGTKHHVHRFTSHLNSPQPIPKIVSSELLWTDEWKTINLLNYGSVKLLVNRPKNGNKNRNKNSTKSHSILIVRRTRYLHAQNDNLRICVQIMQWNFVIPKYTYGHTPKLPPYHSRPLHISSNSHMLAENV